MMNHNGRILAVRQEFEGEKRTMGWAMAARESEILPFNPPRLLTESEDGA